MRANGPEQHKENVLSAPTGWIWGQGLVAPLNSQDQHLGELQRQPFWRLWELVLLSLKEECNSSLKSEKRKHSILSAKVTVLPEWRREDSSFLDVDKITGQPRIKPGCAEQGLILQNGDDRTQGFLSRNVLPHPPLGKWFLGQSLPSKTCSSKRATGMRGKPAVLSHPQRRSPLLPAPHRASRGIPWKGSKKDARSS